MCSVLWCICYTYIIVHYEFYKRVHSMGLYTPNTFQTGIWIALHQIRASGHSIQFSIWVTPKNLLTQIRPLAHFHVFRIYFNGQSIHWILKYIIKFRVRGQSYDVKVQAYLLLPLKQLIIKGAEKIKTTN